MFTVVRPNLSSVASDQSVSFVQSIEGSVERGPAATGSTDAVVNIEVIVANPRSQ